MKRHRGRWILASISTGLVLAALFAPFLAPYGPATQFRNDAHASPALPAIRDDSGRLSWPHVASPSQEEDPGPHFLEFFVEGEPFQWFGWTLNRHLIGLQGREGGLFLLGTDALGRDLLSRLIFGMRFSLAVGFVGIFLTFLLAVPLGALSGYHGGWKDRLIMRTCDLFLSLPGLFLVLGIRAVFPLELSVQGTFWLIAGIFSLMGWGAVTRVVRGQVLSLKQRPYVLASQLAGASDWWVIRHHILPFTANYLLVQATIFLPLFVLGEITLSFLGVGLQEPGVSLGTLLHSASQLSTFRLYQWELIPALAIFLILFSLNLIGDRLKSFDRVRPRWW